MQMRANYVLVLCREDEDVTGFLPWSSTENAVTVRVSQCFRQIYNLDKAAKYQPRCINH